LRSPKILDLQLDRLAVVYIRQSDPQQVLNHRESRERQYALADHAVALGWPRDRVLVIDDDQGLSGYSADDGERPPDPGAPHVRGGVRLRPPTA
jgi:hypothetical protein